MRHLPLNLSLVAVSLVTITGIAVSPAFALESSVSGGTSTRTSEDSTSTSTTVSADDQNGSSTNTSVKSNGSTKSAMVRASSDTSTKAKTEAANDEEASPANLRAAAASLLSKDRQNKKATTVSERQKACSAHQAELKTRQANYEKAAQKHLDNFNGIYAKVLAFQQSKQLTVSNYAALKADADSWQTKAQDAVALISSTDVTVDCSSTDPAVSVSNLKTAVAGARNALQSYRQAIKNLVVALQTAKDASSAPTPTPTPTASTQTNTNAQVNQ